MKSETKYVCEICGAKYDYAEKAINCEKRHVEVDCVKSVNYCGEKYPYYVSIKMEDGIVKNYVMED